MTPSAQQATQAVIDSFGWGYGAGLAFVVLVLYTSHIGRR